MSTASFSALSTNYTSFYFHTYFFAYLGKCLIWCIFSILLEMNICNPFFFSNFLYQFCLRHLFQELYSLDFQRRQWQPTPVLLPGESQGRGSLVGCHLRGHTESDTTAAMQQQQHLLDCNPLQYYCQENPWTEQSGGLLSMGSQRVSHN